MNEDKAKIKDGLVSVGSYDIETVIKLLFVVRDIEILTSDFWTMKRI